MRRLSCLLLCAALLVGLLPAAGAEIPSVTFTTSSRQSIGETDATLACTVEIYGADVSAVSQVGVEVYRNGQIVAAKLEDAVPWGDYIEVWFPLNRELNCVLTAGTTYQYRFYAVVDGALCSSELMSFTTTGGTTVTVTFDANGGSVSPGSKTVNRTGTYGELPIPVREGYAFLCWSPDKSGADFRAVEANDLVDPREDHTLYARWTASGYTVTLDANGGSVERSFQPVRYGGVYGGSAALPVPTWGERTFLGWYTEPSGGDRVTDTTKVTVPANHTLYAHWREESAPEPVVTAGFENFKVVNAYTNGLFRDVDSGNPTHWFASNVAAAYELGLMRGKGEGVFSPRDNMTVAEAVALAARIHCIYHTGSDSIQLYDGGNWYDAYVDYAKKQGLISTNYNYALPVTREEFVHILAHALPEEALPAVNEAVVFADEGSVTYRGDVELLVRAGVIAGVPQESGALYFCPLNTITRGEVAAIVTRMAQPDLRVRRS